MIFRQFPGFDSFKRFISYYCSNYPDKGELIISCLHEIIILMKNLKISDCVDINQTPNDSDRYRHFIIDNYFSAHLTDVTVAQTAFMPRSKNITV